MKHKCPKCGCEWEAPSRNQAKGGKARWKGIKKSDRSEAARAAATARWAAKREEKIASLERQGMSRQEALAAVERAEEIKNALK